VIKVSVIIPVYNTEEFLGECLDSVVNQTLRDLEIICIDDGSTDRSGSIIDTYALKDSRIKVIHRKNGGYGSAVNEGIKRAKGLYIGIVDSDDFISPDMYERLYKEAKKSDAEIVKSDFFEVKRRKNGIDYGKKLVKIAPKNGIILDKCHVIANVGLNIWAAIYKLSFLRENKIKFNESPGAAFQDNGFWFQTIVHAEKIVFTEGAFYHYRKDNPKSSIHDKKKVYDICNEYLFIKNFLKKNPDLYKKHFNDYLTQKFYAYIDAYRRIAEKHKLEFLKIISSEFCEDINTLLDFPEKTDNMEEYVLGEILRIADSPEIYYYESTIDRYTDLYEHTHKSLTRLKDSPAYKVGEKLAAFKNRITFIVKRR